MKIQEIKKIFAVLLMFGFLAGIIYANLFAKAYISSMGIFSDYFLKQYSVANLKTEDYIWYLARVRILPMCLLGVFGCTKLKRPASVICLLWTGFSSGLILTTAVLKMSIKGILLCLIGLIPHFICYVAAYVMILLYLFTYPDIRWTGSKTVSLCIFMMLGVITECYVNPVLMELFIKNL